MKTALRDRMHQEKNVTDVIDTAFNFPGLIKYSQLREELEQLAELVMKRQPSIILEIGTATGGSFYVWSRLAKSTLQLISIDVPSGYSQDKIPFFREFCREKEMFFIRENSHKDSTKQKVQKILGEQKIDFLFIDGDHSYEGVKKDFEMYAPLVQENGIIAFHDIGEGSPKGVLVSKFWEEIKTEFQYKEIIKDGNHNGYGIGVLYYN